MAEHSNTSFKAGELNGQAQVKKDEMMRRATDAAHSCKQSCQESMQQAGGSLQQMKSAAQGSTDAVKNAMGTGDNNNSGATGGGATGC